MRIAVATRYVTRVGGVETYLEQVLPALVARGHVIGVWHESAADPAADRILPRSVPAWHVEASRSAMLHETLAAWKPDVTFLHGLADPAIESTFAARAPLTVFLHGYHGTCISGTKCHAFPSPEPCGRRFGPGCLLRFYPRRCGGLSPVTMWADYATQQRRLAVLTQAAVVATLSDHMRAEAVRHGVEPARAVRLPAFAPAFESRGAPAGTTTSPDTSAPSSTRAGTSRWHLLFVGRMERPKGGQILLEALGQLDRALRSRLRVTFAGDGRERAAWEHVAARMSSGGVDIRFVGSFSPEERARVFSGVDLLVVPSIWPEPLGLVGLEAAAAGIPALAFDVGGIRDWLTDGVTGRLLPATPAWSAVLARGIEECLSSEPRLRTWAAAARAASRSRTLAAHVEALETALHQAAGVRPVAAAQH